MQAIEQVLLHLFALCSAHIDKILDCLLCNLLDCLPHFLFVLLHLHHAEDVGKACHLRNAHIIFNLQILCKIAQRLQVGAGKVVVDDHLGVGAADGLHAQGDIHLAAGDRPFDKVFQLIFQIGVCPRHTGGILQKTMVYRTQLDGDLLVSNHLTGSSISGHAANRAELRLHILGRILLHYLHTPLAVHLLFDRRSDALGVCISILLFYYTWQGSVNKGRGCFAFCLIFLPAAPHQRNLHAVKVYVPRGNVSVMPQVKAVVGTDGCNLLRQRKQVFTAVIGGQQELRLIPADGFGCA